VLIFYKDQPKDSTDDGFESPNPLIDTSNSGVNFSCPTGGSPWPVYDNGASDHGSNFQFRFKEDNGVRNVALPPGAMLKFFIFYGAAANKIAADGALAAVGAELASYGYAHFSTGCSGAKMARLVYTYLHLKVLCSTNFYHHSTIGGIIVVFDA